MQFVTTWLLGVALFAGTIPAAPQVPLAGIAHVAIRVHDLAAAQAFYRKLGFVQAFELSRDGAVYEKYIKVNDRQFIELYGTDRKEPETGFLHLCFEGVDLNAIHDEYVGRGLAPITVRKAGAGNLLLTLAGPMQPGYAQNIEYTQYLPGSLHSEDMGKHLEAQRVADRLLSVTLAMQDPPAARTFYLQKLGFGASVGGSLRLPGPSGMAVEIVGPEFGRKARFTLGTKDLNKAARFLGAHGIHPVKSAHFLTVTDPDGNEIAIEEQAESQI